MLNGFQIRSTRARRCRLSFDRSPRTDYHFTTGKGYLSSQLLKYNNTYGFDPALEYVDLYIPKVALGMNIRIGRFISVPGIEAQLAPNNYTFSHSLLYSIDPFTDTGVIAFCQGDRPLVTARGAYSRARRCSLDERINSATEGYFMYERGVPSTNGPLTPETGANGTACHLGLDRCTAPEYAVVNLLQFEKTTHDFLSLRTDF